MKWKVGKRNSVVVSDEVVINTNFPSPPNPKFSPAEDVGYYGGYLVCESIANSENAKLIAAAPELLNALKHIRDSFWSEGEPYKERFNYLQKYAKETIEKLEVMQ